MGTLALEEDLEDETVLWDTCIQEQWHLYLNAFYRSAIEVFSERFDEDFIIEAHKKLSKNKKVR